MAARGFNRLPVAAVDVLCADAVAVTFDVPDELADTYAFRPGQWVTVRRYDERRSYSICSPAGARPRIGVREIPGGLLSRWLVNDVRVGDLVEVAPPAGTFTPELEAAGRHVMIAAGSGIIPVLSIATTLLRHPDAEIDLLYGNRRADTIMFAEELADLKDRYPSRLNLMHVLSREPRDVELLTGRLDATKLRTLLPLLAAPTTVDQWWLCGPYAMVVDAVEVLGEAGVDAARIHRELFWVDQAPPAPVRPDPAPGGVGRDVTVVLDGRATMVPAAEGETVLHAAQRVRPDVPFACQGGVCGTCRARVVAGEVRMRRNFALEPAEVAAGYVLTCQSIPVTGSVTVTFDD